MNMMNINFAWYETHLELFTMFFNEMSCLHTGNIDINSQNNQ